MIPWLLTAALAAPPEGIDPDDFSHWEVAADRALDGPEGCWELSGAVRVDGGLHSAGTAFLRGDTYRIKGVGTWEGRIDSGKWRSFTYVWQDQSIGDLNVPIFPAIGTIDPKVVVNATPKPEPSEGEDKEGSNVSISIGAGGEDGAGGTSTEAINIFHEIVDSWEPAGSTTVSEWDNDAGAIRLIQDIPLLDRVNPPVVSVTSTFPGGSEHPTIIDAVFPKRVKLGEWPMRVTLMDTQFHLRQQPVGDQVLPQVEGFTLMAGVLGFTLGYEQQITYATAQACTSSTE